MKRKGGAIYEKIGIALLVSILLVLMAVPVQADNINYTTIRGKGRTYYLSIEFNRKYQMRSRLYQKTSSGKRLWLLQDLPMKTVSNMWERMAINCTSVISIIHASELTVIQLERADLNWRMEAFICRQCVETMHMGTDRSQMTTHPQSCIFIMLRPENQHTLAWDTSLISNILR